MPHSKENPGWHLFQLSAEVGSHPAGAPPGDKKGGRNENSWANGGLMVICW